jgi:hypothetical protein
MPGIVSSNVDVAAADADADADSPPDASLATVSVRRNLGCLASSMSCPGFCRWS